MLMDVIKQLNNIFYNKHIADELRSYLHNKVTYANYSYKKKFQQYPHKQFVLEKNRLIFKQGNTHLPLHETDDQKKGSIRQSI
jgi:hypothetical protein